MSISVNKSAFHHLSGLIDEGKFDRDTKWEWSTQDENELLGDESDDWPRFASVHLGVDLDKEKNSRNRFSFPVAKVDGDSEKVFRSGLLAAKKAAIRQAENEIRDVADQLLNAIDSKNDKEAKSMSKFQRIKSGLLANVKHRAAAAAEIRTLYRDVLMHVSERSRPMALKLLDTDRMSAAEILEAVAVAENTSGLGQTSLYTEGQKMGAELLGKADTVPNFSPVSFL